MTLHTSPQYQKEFFLLQLAMAQKIAEIEHKSIDQVVLRSTAFYRMFGLDWSFDPTHPVWEAYLVGLRHSIDHVLYTYEYYLHRYPTIPTSVEVQAHWGCFAYDYKAETRKIKLHFGDYDQSGHGPLSHLRIAQRKEELWAMFCHIQHHHPDALWATGGSWLYKLGSVHPAFSAVIWTSRQTSGKAFPARPRQLEPILAERERTAEGPVEAVLCPVHARYKNWVRVLVTASCILDLSGTGVLEQETATRVYTQKRQRPHRFGLLPDNKVEGRRRYPGRN